MKKFYIEFVYWLNSPNYCIQSKWFKNKKSAINWYNKNFDFVDDAQIGVYLMCAEFNECDEIVGDIEQLYKIN